MTINTHFSNSLGGTDKWWRDTAIGVFDTHTGAEQAVTELERSGLDMKMLWIVGKGYHSEEHLVAGLLSILGVPKDSIIKYEIQLKANNYLVIAHGSPQEAESALAILQQSAATETEIVNSHAPNIANHVTIS